MSQLLDIVIPDIGDIGEVEVIDILVAVGDRVDVEAALLTVESDKAAMDIPNEQAGRLVEWLVAVGDKVKQGQLFARIEVTAVEAIESDIASPAQEPVLPSDKPELPSPISVPEVELVNLSGQQCLAPSGPAARRLARELGVEINKVVGSGRRGRIFKEDVKAYAKTLLNSFESSTNRVLDGVAKLPDLSKFGPTHTENLSKVELVTSRNMQRAWQEIPHAWLQQRVDITDLDQGRKRLKQENPNITLTALIIKAVALGLQEFPRFNGVIDVPAQQLIYRDYMNIGVAVDTPRGLVVAVIRNVDTLTVALIGKELSRLSTLARNGKMHISDMQGAGMTVSSLGGLGIDALQPIVNWPEVAILGVAKASMQPVFNEGEFEPRLLLPLTLGFDHRVINGADGARFLSYLQRLLSDPMRLMVNI